MELHPREIGREEVENLLERKPIEIDRETRGITLIHFYITLLFYSCYIMQKSSPGQYKKY